MSFKQAPRLPTDGQVAVTHLDADHLILSATTDGEDQVLRVSRHNAARLFGLLAVFLEIPLSPKVGKAIKL